MGTFRLLVAVLLLAGLTACSQDFWDRSPRVGGCVQPSPCAPAPQAMAPCAPQASLPPPQIRDCPPPACTPCPPSPCAPSACAPSASGGPSAEEQQVLQQVNAIRCARGLRPFTWNPNLYVAARDHSLEQQRCGYMGHDSPDPNRRTLVQRMQLAGYDGVMYGEVVAWGYKDTSAVVEGWMNSREHRAILVDGQLTQAAFSRVCDYWTGNFGTPRCGTYAPRAAAPYPASSYPQASCPPTACVPAPCAPYSQPAVRAPIAQTPCAPSPSRYVPPPAVAPVQAPRATRAPIRGG